MFFQNLSQFLCRDCAVLIDIKETERVFEGESLVTEKRTLSVLNLLVRPDQLLHEAQEHKVFDLTLFLKLFARFLLLSYFLFFGFDLLVKNGPCLSSLAFFLIAFLLTLSRRKVVCRDSLLAPLSRALALLCRPFLLRRALAKIFSLIYVFDTVIESSIFISALIFNFIFCYLLLLLLLLRLTRTNDTGNLAELRVADATVCIVVASAKNSFDIFSTGEETIAFQVVDEVGHCDVLVSLSDRFESPDFDKVRAISKLALGVLALPVKLHLLVEEPGKERENFVRNGHSGAIVRRETSRCRDVAQVRVRRGKHQLGELLEVKHVVL